MPTAKLVNGKAYSIISDHLGTPILAVDSAGGNPTLYGYVFDPNIQIDPLGLDNNDIVIRGGIKPLSEGSGVTRNDGRLSGISVNVSTGRTKEELSSPLPHSQIATTREQIEATGATIVPAPSKANPYYALINDIPEKEAEKLFSKKEKNPIPKEQRCIKNKEYETKNRSKL